MNVLFLSFTCEDIGVAIVTNMITIAIVTQSLNAYLDMLLYDRNIIGAFSEIFGNLRLSSENVRKMFGNVRLTFGKIWENLWKSSETGRKSSENLQSLVCLCNKQNITCPLVDMNFIFSCSTRHRVQHSKIKFISTRGHVISSIYTLVKIPLNL